jgi:hypothetical protein
MEGRAETRRHQCELRRNFVNRALKRPGSIGEEVEANNVRMARAAREAEPVWWAERRTRRAAWSGR